MDLRILVVDDDALQRRMMRRFITSLGLTWAGEAANGKDALTILAGGGIDLVLTDFEMPHMDGLTMVQKMREAGDQTQVVMISGRSDPALETIALGAGVQAFVPKPVDVALLTGKLLQTAARLRPAA